MKNILLVFPLALGWLLLIVGTGIWTGRLTVSPAIMSWGSEVASTTYYHLRLSIIPFGLLLALYSFLIIRLRMLLAQQKAEPAQLSFYDRLLNVTISAFFGVGVIWTAVGMESALVEALAGIDQGQQADHILSAGQLLERLVNGGLLLALSTTIFGGVCGYLLRLLRIMLLGKRWDQFIFQEEQSNETAEAAARA